MDKNYYNILLVDDEKSIRDTLSIVLEDAGFSISTAKDGDEALEYIKHNIVDVLITDLKMPRMNGIELLKKVLKVDETLQVIFISAYADIKAAVEAIKLGAFDYIQKSFSSDDLLFTVEKAIERKKIIEENICLKNRLHMKREQKGFIGKSENMQILISTVERIAKSKATVLLTGESGVGKEVLAKLIHQKSERFNKKLITINCGAIPENLIESELFGYEKGAFTGANTLKVGKFQQANDGTIFLDEIGDLPASLQVKLLRVLQERQLERLGSLNSIHIDIRVIAATNKDLLEEVKKGNFREDLYYRLNVINLKIPPLRERVEDIPLLAEYFLDLFSNEYHKNLKFINIEAMSVLLQHQWKGNVRELKNVIERSVAMVDEGEEILSIKHLPVEMSNDKAMERIENNHLTLKDLEKMYIINTLKQVRFNKTIAADILGINRQTLYNKMKEYKIIV